MTRAWRLHGGLFLLTILTTTLAGMFHAAPLLAFSEPPLNNPLDYLLYIPLTYFYSIIELINHAVEPSACDRRRCDVLSLIAGDSVLA